MADRVGQQLGNYRLLRVLGRGAFAEVYLGEHQYLEMPAAIKVLAVQMESEMQQSFRREARTIAHLQHPHIVHVFDFGFQDQTPYLVMEYLPNGTLRRRHPKGTRLPLEQIVSYVKQLAPALDYAHQQRVIHRDVKPENILLDAQQEVVLSDFGIAVVQQSRESLSTQHPAGTPLYMAPEQIQGKPCAASDQYALAVVVYEWLCGEPPFRGSLFELYSQHLYQPPPDLCARLPHLPSIVEDAVLGALAKDPQQRFSSVQDFATVLEEAFFVTQSSVSPILLERQGQDQQALPATLSALAPRAGEEGLSTETTSPRLMTSPPTADKQEPLQSVTPLPVIVGQTISQPARPSVAQSNRQRFLKRVRTFWIEGVLEHSLHGAALTTLGLQEQLDALANPWHLVLQYPDATPRAFALGTRITEVYDAANGELLILGAPGSGKTTLLLELARDLLDRAEQDERQQVPVVFTLSSWATKQQALGEWMIEELISKYQVPRQLARIWGRTDQILPLLDGLDEMSAKDRTACIETINTYQQKHGLLPLVVCSRSADYLAQTARVRLGSAVMVQPLTQQQVDDYLASGGEPLWALRVALHQDAALRELTETPLMLSILTLTYHDLPVEELLRGGIAPTRQQVFKQYVERMLAHRGVSKRFPREQTRQLLTFIAAQMQQHHQTALYLEYLQPDWLVDRQKRRLYQLLYALIVGLGSGLLFGLGSGLIFGLARGLTFGLVDGLVVGLSFGLGTGLVGWLLGSFSASQCAERLHLKPNQGIWRSVRNGLVGGLVVGLVVGLGSSLVAALVGARVGTLNDPLVGTLTNPLFAGLVFGPFFGLIGGIGIGLFGLGRPIEPQEVLTWSWRKQRLVTRLLCVVGGGLLGGLIVWLEELFWRASSAPFWGVVGGLVIGGLAGRLVSGFSTKQLDEHLRLKPNQGIWRSARNGLVVGLIVGLVGGLAGLIVGLVGGLAGGVVGALSVEVTSVPVAWLASSLIRMLVIGLVLGLLFFGLGAFLQHFTLRFLLWRTGCLPWNVVAFLDEVAERLLLRKVGGGYIFAHRLLLEYFASLDIPPTSEAARAKKEQAEPAS